MQIEDILKYSHQLIAYFHNDEPLKFNGFFVEYHNNYYFVTVNHGVAPDLKETDKICFILHANSIGIATRIIPIKNWQFIDFYEQNEKQEKYSIPRCKREEREDFAFFGVNIEEMGKSVEMLPFRLQDADDASCHNKTVYPITLPEDIALPTKDKKYFVVGKLLHNINPACKKYDILSFEGMEYIGDFEGIHEFKIKQITDYKHCSGLSGSPVFDEDMNFVGMAIRYREEDNVLRVYPASDIKYYLHNDCTILPEEQDYYNK